MTTPRTDHRLPDRPLRAKRRIALLAAGFGAYLLSLLFPHMPGVTEAIYGTTIGPLMAKTLSLITGIVPFTLAELLVLAVIARQVVGLARGLLAVRRGRRWQNVLQAGLLRFGQDIGVVIASFYLLWGFNYSRAPLPARLDWPAPDGITANELAELSEQMVHAANREYRLIHGTDDVGAPTGLSERVRELERSIDDGWVSARQDMDLPYLRGRYGRTKLTLFTPWSEWAGVTGFYFPFTGEANLRRGLPGVNEPMSMAHEKAHQRGVARESEANFWGYMSAARASDARARYAAYVFAQRQLLSNLVRADRDRTVDLVGARLPGVQRDIDSSRAYFQRFRGTGTAIVQTVNNAYLRSNRVEGGVRSYSLSVRLFVSYARLNGNTLDPQLRPTNSASARASDRP